DLVARARPGDATFVEVPVGHVVDGIAQDVGGEVGGQKVQEPLVEEQLFLGRDEAVAAQAFLPPLDEGTGGRAEGDEAEVVDAGGGDVGEGGLAAIGGDGAQGVGDEVDG